MHVIDILDDKGRTVVHVAPTATLGEVVGRLAEKRIGAVVVTDGGGRVAGILSERDVVRALAADAVSALGQPVRRYMTEEVETCRPGDTIDSLMRRMTDGKFRHMPVVDAADRLAGIVSIGDVVKRKIAHVEFEAESLRAYIVGNA